MNRLKTLAIILTTLAFASCDRGKTTPTPELPDQTVFTGTFTVASGTESEFILDDAQVSLAVGEDKATVDIQMLKVRFAERMPEMDITIPGAALTRDDTGAYRITGDDIVPIAMGGPFAQYTITDLEGDIDETGGQIIFSMMCGSFPLSFTGTREALPKI